MSICLVSSEVYLPSRQEKEILEFEVSAVHEALRITILAFRKDKKNEQPYSLSASSHKLMSLPWVALPVVLEDWADIKWGKDAIIYIIATWSIQVSFQLKRNSPPLYCPYFVFTWFFITYIFLLI